jgi:hypothetical protein
MQIAAEGRLPHKASQSTAKQRGANIICIIKEVYKSIPAAPALRPPLVAQPVRLLSNPLLYDLEVCFVVELHISEMRVAMHSYVLHPDPVRVNANLI